MSTSDDLDLALAADIEAAVRTVPGVVAVYRPGSTASKVVDTAARLLGIRDEAAPLIRLAQTPDGLRVEIAIGVHASEGAPDTARRAHTAVQALLAHHSAPAAGIHLTVVHVDETAPRNGTP